MNLHLVRRHNVSWFPLPQQKATVVTWLGAVCQKDVQSKSHQEAWEGRVSAEKVGDRRSTVNGDVGHPVCMAREE